MEEVIGSISIRSTNEATALAEITKSALYAFDKLALIPHSLQYVLRHHLSGPEDHRLPGSAPLS
jgi:hypothetical protein